MNSVRTVRFLDVSGHLRWHAARVTSAQASLKDALRSVLGPAARVRGYKGTAPTWRKMNTNGDCAVVNVQTESFGTAQRLSCVLNLAVVPEPWLRWLRGQLGSRMPRSVTEYLGLYRDRLHSGGAVGDRGWWEVDGPESAAAAVTAMVEQLELIAWPALDRMLMPDGMLDQVRRGDLGYMKRASYKVFFARAEALLIMDLGPSGRLDDRLRFALKHSIPSQKDDAARFDAWVRDQARNGG